MFKHLLMLTAFLLFTPVTLAAELSQEQKLMVEQLVEEKVNTFIQSDAFQQAISEGIYRFIETQNAQRAEQEAKTKARQAEIILPVTSQDHVYGDPDARYTLIEYSDYECPFCKKFHVTAESFVDAHSDVNWVYRHFPLDFHNPGAQTEAEAAECAAEVGGKQAFWDYSRLIFQRTRSNGKGFPIENLTPLAEELGYDVKAFAQCLEAGTFKNKVLQQFQQGQSAGVSGTPGNFLVDNQKGTIIPVTGAQPLEVLEQVLQQLKEEN
ncbi:DsbA family protein [Gynuella sunshinyii]|uniref:Protein-disulfide isomerase n=1 Tax=Gynuella sunshinyii YC6258 TaxID=1445510 RepID=A0A0C5VS26_9GAMM|nr:DsbA family protein [Gynuella sunshinyii]AJQ97457.1 protein-disulfide isomerase [Gynuella sunshinyii YC6258]